ncbi:MAG: SOS response-associated peptidase [Pyrinomonadaceae bacterium]
MCGRYAQTNPSKILIKYYGLTKAPEINARYNIAPTQQAPVVKLNEKGEPELVMMRWGLIPTWAKDPSTGARLINARAETVKEKPSFRAAYKKRRCLVPASGFYEWKRAGAKKQPYFVHPKDEPLFSFAGLWEHWFDAEEKRLETFTIVTTDANGFMRKLHERMPVIVKRPDFQAWLNPALAQDDPWQKPYPDDIMGSYPVSLRVNSPRNDDESLLVADTPKA